MAMVEDQVHMEIMTIDIISRTDLIENMVNIVNMGMIAEIMVMANIGDMIMINSTAL
jgi:hypothetical protein